MKKHSKPFQAAIAKVQAVINQDVPRSVKSQAIDKFKKAWPSPEGQDIAGALRSALQAAESAKMSQSRPR